MSISVEVFEQIRRSYLEGKSQAQIARELDVSRNTVRKYCNGDNVPWDRKVTERASPVMTDETDKFILACLLGGRRKRGSEKTKAHSQTDI